MMEMVENRYDLVVFGATGYTGSYAVEEVARTALKTGVTWAVAGRNRSKLEKVLKNASDATELDLSTIPVIISDVSNEESLAGMARQARVVINTVGPYRFYGEAVVKACIENGASHVDVSGESQFLQKMQLQYNELAEEKKVYVIGACGLDSIPVDLGVLYLSKKFIGDLNSVESYMKVDISETNFRTPLLHYGTWQSLIHVIGHLGELKDLRRKLYKKVDPPPAYKQTKRFPLHYNNIVNAWCLPFMGSDRSVAIRSQNFFQQNYMQRPVQIMTYIQMASFIHAILLIFGLPFIIVLAQWKFGRALLEKFPRFFSLGLVSHEKLSREMNEKVKFEITLVGTGWDEKLAEPTDQHQQPPNKTLTAKVKGTNPAYGSTCKFLVQSALTILKEADKMPGSGGVLSPAAAFSKTTLIDRLIELGVIFEVEI